MYIIPVFKSYVNNKRIWCKYKTMNAFVYSFDVSHRTPIKSLILFSPLIYFGIYLLIWYPCQFERRALVDRHVHSVIWRNGNHRAERRRSALVAPLRQVELAVSWVPFVFLPISHVSYTCPIRKKLYRPKTRLNNSIPLPGII